MAIPGAFSAAATFFYAVSTLLSGAKQNAMLQESIRASFDSPTNQLIPVNLTRPGSGIARDTNGYWAMEEMDQTLFLDGRRGGVVSPRTEVLYLLTPRVRRKFEEMSLSPPEKINFYDGQTIASIETDRFGNITSCVVTEVKPQEIKDALDSLTRSNEVIEKTSFRTMIDIMASCEELDQQNKSSRDPKSNEIFPSNVFISPKELLDAKNANIRTLVSGILPGTKWCGLGDVAQSYHDLGVDESIDRCCRNHDLCPLKVKAFRSRYGIVNWSIYTKSHCDCDDILYNCIKNSNSNFAEVMGNFYFNVLQVQCIDSVREPKCLQSIESNTCLHWDLDGKENQTLVTRPVQRSF